MGGGGGSGNIVSDIDVAIMEIYKLNNESLKVKSIGIIWQWVGVNGK